MAHDTNALDDTTAARERPTDQQFVLGRDIGPVGRIFRLGFVIIGIASLSARIADELDGAGLVRMLLYVCLIFGAYTLLFWAMSRWVFDRVSPWTASAILIVPTLLYPLEVGSTAFHNALAVFTTGSALLCPLIGYGGLEVASFPALILGRRPVTYSPFNTTDAVERGFTAPGAQRGLLWMLSIAVTVICFLDYWYAALLLTVPVVERNVDAGIDLPGVYALALLLPVGYLAVRAQRTKSDDSSLSRRYALAAGFTALLMLMFLGDQVAHHTLWGLILLSGIVVGIVRLFRRPTPAPAN